MAASAQVDYMAEFQQHFSQERAIEQIKAIRNVSHVFQYMQEPYYNAIRFSKLTDVRTARPLLHVAHCTSNQVHPLDDAYTMLVKALLRKMCNRQLLPTKRCGSRHFSSTHDGVVLF